MISKAVALSLLAAGTQSALTSSDQQSLGLDISKCTGSFQDTVNLLYMNCVDDNGNLVDRYQRLFVKPLIKECGQVNSTMLRQPAVVPTPINNNSTAPIANSALPIDNSTLPIDNSTLPIGNSTVPIDNSTLPIDNSTTTTGMINCCDYYQTGSGYEFSVCDSMGAFVRQDLIGGEKDSFYAAQTILSQDFSWVW